MDKGKTEIGGERMRIYWPWDVRWFLKHLKTDMEDYGLGLWVFIRLVAPVIMMVWPGRWLGEGKAKE